MRFRDLEHRLLARSVVIPPGEPHAGCWLWLGRVEPNGYAKVSVYTGFERGRSRMRSAWVHRVAYNAFHCAEIPEGWQIDHRCRLPVCINPNHLECVPKTVNEHERVNKRRGANGKYQ